MRKMLALLVLGGIVLSCAAAFAQTEPPYTQTLLPGPGGRTGVNWIALKGVPFEPDPVGNVNWDTFEASSQGVFWQGDIDSTLGLIDGSLARLDPTTNNPILYLSSDTPPGSAFGKCLLGEGYTISIGDGASHTISYNGVLDGVPSDLNNPTTTMTDMWISLPGKTGAEGGWHWVGHPFNHNIPFADVKVTDGTETIDIFTAIDRQWLQGSWAYWDAQFQSPQQVDPDGIVGSPFLEPGRMYKVRTFKSNLALIIPAVAVTEY